jgi:hypothetical protein
LEPEDLTGIDPVWILNHVGVEPVDLRPKERIAQILARQVPKGIARPDLVRVGSGSLGHDCAGHDQSGEDGQQATWA